MRERFRRFTQDRFLLLPFFFGLFGNAATFAVLFTTLIPTEQPVPLHYNIYFGIDAIGPWYAYYYLPAGSVALLIFNCILAFWVVRSDRMLSRILLGTAAIIALLILITTIVITRNLL
ncbi:MAG: hypothetical protein WCV86_03200 [Patescibacteria group bacterium]|jgi:hypothetical protein